MGVSFDTIFEVPSSQSIVGARVSAAGCNNAYQKGYFFIVSENGEWSLNAGAKVLKTGKSTSWNSQSNRLELTVTDNKISAYINYQLQTTMTDNSFSYGYAAVGSSWNYVQFDNFALVVSPLNCGTGNRAVVGPCNELASPAWIYTETTTYSTLQWATNTTQCLDIGPPDPRSGSPSAIVTQCDPENNSNQIWKFNERKIIHKNTNYCLDITGASQSPCSGVEIYPCVDGAMNQEWVLNGPSGLVISPETGSCLTVGS